MMLLSSALNSFFQLLGAILIFIFVLVITYYTTKWIGGYQKAHMMGKHLETVETVRLVGNKYLQIIKAGEVYLVVAVGKDEVTLLAQLTAEQLGITGEHLAENLQQKQPGNEKNKTETFQEALERVKRHFPDRQD